MKRSESRHICDINVMELLMYLIRDVGGLGNALHVKVSFISSALRTGHPIQFNLR